MGFFFLKSWKTAVFSWLAIVSAASLAGCSTSSSPTWRQYNRQGYEAANRDDWVAAEKSYTAALEKAEQFRLGDYRLSRSLDRLASVKISLRKYPEAETLCRRRLEIDEKRGLTNNMHFVEALVTLADVQAHQKHFEEAEKLVLHAESIIEFKYSYVTPVLGLLIAKRAAVYEMAGRLDDSEDAYASSKAKLDTLERGLRSTSPERDWVLIQTGFMYNDYALLKERMEKYSDAQELLIESIGILEIQCGKKSPRLVNVLNNLARVYAKENNYEDAEATIGRAMRIVEKNMPPGNPVAADSRALQTAILARQVQ